MKVLHCLYGLVVALIAMKTIGITNPAAGQIPATGGRFGPADSGSPSLRIVKYDALKEAVRRLRGRVVVVDFWSTT